MLDKLENLLKTEIDPAFAQRARFIFKEIEKQKPKRILDIGCGRGFYVYASTLYNFPKEIHGVEISKKYLEIAQKNISDKRVTLTSGSIYNLSYKNNYFDVIICSEVLEHLTDDMKALQELKRILSPHGVLLMTVPNYRFPFFWDPLNWILMKVFNTHVNKNIWWLAGIWADHERLYTVEELQKKLKSSGFKLGKLQSIIQHCWPFTHFILYGIGKNIVEKFGISELNRFNVKEKGLSFVLSTLMTFPSKLDNNSTFNSVCLACIAKK